MHISVFLIFDDNDELIRFPAGGGSKTKQTPINPTCLGGGVLICLIEEDDDNNFLLAIKMLQAPRPLQHLLC